VTVAQSGTGSTLFGTTDAPAALGLAAGEIGRVAVLAPGATVMADMVGSVARVVSVTLKIRFC
jgi:hypothetical protein